MQETERFWLVWRRDGLKPPKFEHQTQGSAEQEAVRLAKITGYEYFVLEVIGSARKREIPSEIFSSGGHITRYRSNVPDETLRKDLEIS